MTGRHRTQPEPLDLAWLQEVAGRAALDPEQVETIGQAYRLAHTCSVCHGNGIQSTDGFGRPVYCWHCETQPGRQWPGIPQRPREPTQ